MTKRKDERALVEGLTHLIQTTTSSAISKASAIKAYEIYLTEKQRLHNRHYQSYGRRIIPGIVIGYLLIVGVIVFFDGFTNDHFYLPTSVMVTLLCTTTINVLGLMYIVAHHLFPKQP